MNRLKIAAIVSSLVFALSGQAVLSQGTQPKTSWSQADTVRIVQEVQKQVSRLPDYGVFDWVTFGIHGRTVVLKGYVSRPILKDEAGRVVKGIPGVATVENQIETLPLSPSDDRVRASVYNRIYTAPSLAKYNANAGGTRRGASVARMAGGITNDPPTGYHAIHIIVKNGNVVLFGAVLNSMDSAIANMQANSAPEAFSVDNDLVVEGTKPERK